MLRLGRLASSVVGERGVSSSLRYFSSAAARVRVASTKRTTFLVREDRVEVKGTSEEARFINNPLFVHSFPGSRVIELNRPGYGNPLTRTSVGALKGSLEMLEDNNIVEIVFVGSCNELTDVFSIGLCPQTLKLNRRGLFSDVSALAQQMDGYKKKLGSIVSGKMPGSVLGLLLNSKYRLGTPSLSVTVDELSDGYMPAGGLAYTCSRLAGPEGKLLARYLAFSQNKIESAELYRAGLLTHLVEDSPHYSLCGAMGRSLGSESQAVQQNPVHSAALDNLLDDLHAGDDDTLELDPMADPYWSKFMLIPPQPLPLDRLTAEPNAFQNILESAAKCFSAPTMEDVIKRVADAAPMTVKPHAAPSSEYEIDANPELKNQWAADTLLGLMNADPLSAKAWLRLTSVCADPKMSLKSALELETRVNIKLLESNASKVRVAHNLESREAIKAELLARFAAVRDSDVDALFSEN